MLVIPSWYNKVIHKVTLSFTPYRFCFQSPIPSFWWYWQSNEILLNHGMKCWNGTPYCLCFQSPIPSFWWYRQSNEILLNLSMKCWNWAFLCTMFGSNYSSCTGKRRENICSSSEGAQENGKRVWNSVYHQNWWKRKEGMKLSLPSKLVKTERGDETQFTTKIGEKTSLGPCYFVL